MLRTVLHLPCTISCIILSIILFSSSRAWSLKRMKYHPVGYSTTKTGVLLSESVNLANKCRGKIEGMQLHYVTWSITRRIYVEGRIRRLFFLRFSIREKRGRLIQIHRWYCTNRDVSPFLHRCLQVSRHRTVSSCLFERWLNIPCNYADKKEQRVSFTQSSAYGSQLHGFRCTTHDKETYDRTQRRLNDRKYAGRCFWKWNASSGSVLVGHLIRGVSRNRLSGWQCTCVQ